MPNAKVRLARYGFCVYESKAGFICVKQQEPTGPVVVAFHPSEIKPLIGALLTSYHDLTGHPLLDTGSATD